MGQRLHPNDTRRVARALQVFDTTGMPMSTVLARQAARLSQASSSSSSSAQEGGSSAAALDAARVYWLTVDDKAVHNARLDARVEGMLAQGMVAEVKALRAHLCDLSAAAVSCPSPSRATLTGVSFPGWAAPSNAFGSALAPDDAAIRPGGSKREVPLLLKRQQMKRLFSAANSPQLQLLCVRIFFNEGGWAKARIVAARKPLPPDHRRETKERELRRQDSHGD
jgi:tmRNA-binding protein